MNKNKNIRPKILKKYIANAVGVESISAQIKNNSNKHIANAVGVVASYACDICNSRRSNSYPNSDPHSRGITLIALIITIIVMLILVGVSITIAIKGGLFDTTKKAAKGTEEAKNAEQELASGRVKIDGVWYDSIEDYVGGNKSDNQTDPVKPEEPVTPPEEIIKPQIGDYILYEPDTVSSPYLLEGRYSGYGDYDISTKPYTFTTPKDQSIVQEKLEWQVLKVYDDGRLDLIGTPTTEKVYFGGSLGYNNGVYLMHDICKKLYSKPSEGIKEESVRSISLEDFEDESNGGNWKSARDANTGYNNKQTYTDANYIWYPNLYARENGSGIDKTEVETKGINSTDKGYDSPTTETLSKASSRLTMTQSRYNLVIDETNYGKTAKVLSSSNLYWLASRMVSAGNWGTFGFRIAGGPNNNLHATNIFNSDGYGGNDSYSLRPIVSLGSSSQLSLKIEGTDGAPNTFEITKY